MRVRAPKRFSFDSASIWVLTLSVALAAIAFIPGHRQSRSFILKSPILAIGGLIALALYILARLTRGNIIVPPVPLLGALWLVPLAYALSTLFLRSRHQRIVLSGLSLNQTRFGFMLCFAIFATLTALRIPSHSNQYRTFFKVGSVATRAFSACCGDRIPFSRTGYAEHCFGIVKPCRIIR